ncbi:MAG TPA: MBL fold metallo-hydrolase [Geminicoccus sp.]|jgi:glyoxylase-like metal-dependent hydrolase (beta-lactamase superfamily II)|uniref:MBL fold metallo-hydrolase n=1 Tax=Geminicoccus sp. TaxID=2024832 RepID=UPI002E31BB64|nr:MBL fold metallo-hydrolase [Geminicoccus sp.]HEX2527582.1 MBL fold metallo-hydrolase [Geminicoccus sp.]
MSERYQPEVTGFFHEETNSVAYVCADPDTRRCAVIDPVLDLDRNARATHTEFADRLLGFIRERGLAVDWILDTHPHADHFSAAFHLKEKLAAPTAIGSRVVVVQRIWKEIYNLPDFPADGSQWDRLFDDGDRFRIGGMEAEVLFTPGHTAASIAYRVGDAAFVHDTLFMPDAGTARADFPGGDARTQWRSIRRLLDLPPRTRIFTGHDYMPGGREPRWESTVAEQRAHNIHVRDGVTEEEFVRMREERDATLPLPGLMMDALQVNMRGGRLPEPEPNGTSYLKIPLNRFPPRRK